MAERSTYGVEVGDEFVTDRHAQHMLVLRQRFESPPRALARREDRRQRCRGAVMGVGGFGAGVRCLSIQFRAGTAQRRRRRQATEQIGRRLLRQKGGDECFDLFFRAPRGAGQDLLESFLIQDIA